MTVANENLDSAVAIVGIACRFPGADGIDQLWQNLCDGVESITRFTEDELEAAGVPRSIYGAADYVPAAGTITGIEQFDAGLFGYSAMEAAIIDPQQRLFLEKCWEALEDAGQDPERFRGRIGVFGGAGAPMYLLRNLFPSAALRARFGQMVLLTSNMVDSMCTRVSYKLNLRGPSIAVQTNCSTSLVACHLAVQSVLSGECDLALAGGARVRVSRAGYVYTEGGIASADGHCRAFDAAADGTVGGEGVGVVVLQRLSDALEQGANIYATIRGSAINNDGSNKVSFTAPSIASQAEVIAEALDVAGVDVDSIGYVEAHGTGTHLGDPIEVAALTRAFRAHTDRVGFCALGSIKTNFGHTDAAAGVAGLIKCALAIQRGAIPPSLHFRSPNPELHIETSPFRVAAALAPWPDTGGPRRGGVSSLGVGGTNVHMVLEQAPAPGAPPPEAVSQLIALSARTRAALDDLSRAIGGRLESDPGLDLADAAFTLQVGRRQLPERRVVVCRDRAQAAGALTSLESTLTGRAGSPPLVVFMFPGGGAQHVDMARQLHDDEPVFREALDACVDRLRARHDIDIVPCLYPPAGADREAATRAIRRSTIGLPSLFAVEHALACLWQSWGIRPAAVIGHSLGEYAAAAVGGVMSWQDALDLVVTRARLFDTLPEGRMLSVPVPESELLQLVPQGVSVAAVNAPSLCVAAGPSELILALEQRLSARDVDFDRVHIDVAAHSSMIDRILAEFTARTAGIALAPPRIPIVSNVSGDWLSEGEAADPTYWARHLRQTVRFAAGIQTAAQLGDCVFLEVGPGRTLTTLARQQLGSSRVHASMRHPRDTEPDGAVVLAALGKLWLTGQEVEWTAVHRGKPRRRVSLPGYPFERRRHWIDPPTGSVATDSDLPFEPAPAPEPDAADSARGDRVTPYLPPEGDDETAMVAIWRELLGTTEIGATDDFFELGGHSLLATQLMAQVRKRFGVVLPRNTVFEARTVRELARTVASGRNQAASGPDLSPSGATSAPATPGQLWFYHLHRSDPDNESVWSPLCRRIEGPLDLQRLVDAFGLFLRRNQIFTTGYREVDGRVDQVLLDPPARPPLEVIDRSELPEDAWPQLVDELDATLRGRPLDLATGPFLAGVLVVLRPDRHLLFLRVHHIAMDAFTMGTIVPGIGAIYDQLIGAVAADDDGPVLQYIDHAVHTARWEGTAAGQAARRYWDEQLRDAAGLQLPVERPREPLDRERDRVPLGIVASAMHYHQGVVPVDVQARIAELSRGEAIAPAAVHLGALAALLHSLTGQADLCIEALDNLRLDDDRLMPIHGILVSQPVIRLNLSDRPSMRELFDRAQRALRQAASHARANVLEIAGHPLRRANFNYVPARPEAAAAFAPAAGLRTVAMRPTPGRGAWKRPWDLQLFVLDREPAAVVTLSLNSMLFEQASAARFLHHYLELLGKAV